MATLDEIKIEVNKYYENILQRTPIDDEVNVTGLPHVFVTNADGTGVRHVTIGPDFFEVGRPTWGPVAP